MIYLRNALALFSGARANTNNSEFWVPSRESLCTLFQKVSQPSSLLRMEYGRENGRENGDTQLQWCLGHNHPRNSYNRTQREKVIPKPGSYSSGGIQKRWFGSSKSISWEFLSMPTRQEKAKEVAMDLIEWVDLPKRAAASILALENTRWRRALIQPMLLELFFWIEMEKPSPFPKQLLPRQVNLQTSHGAEVSIKVWPSEGMVKEEVPLVLSWVLEMKCRTGCKTTLAHIGE